MSQYSTGTVLVTNGSAAVVGTGTSWLAEVTVGQQFIVQGMGVVYEVASVTDDTNMSLTTNYGQATDPTALYVVTRDYSPTYGIPLMGRSDQESAAIYTRAMGIVETAISDFAGGAYATESYNWAQYAEDTLVPEGNMVDEYSSYHYSIKADGSATLAEEWATTTGALVAATDYSAKEYAIGTTVAAGSAKDWATETGAQVDGADYSAKEYAIGTFVPAGSAKEWAMTVEDTLVDGVSYSALHYSAKSATSAAAALVSEDNAEDWASLTGGLVEATDYSAKEWAIGTTVAAGSAADWAVLTSGTVNGSEYSAKEYAIGVLVPAGSAKDWATLGEDIVVDGGSGYSALHYATKAIASADLAQDWATLGTIVASTDYSAKEYAVGTPPQGSAKEWATTAEDTLVDGGFYSALHYAAKAEASKTAAETAETNAETAETNAAASYDAFDDRYLGSKTADPTLDNDGAALLTGALYWNSVNDVLKIYNGSTWIEAGSGTANITEWTATASQTTFSGLDDNGLSLSYTPGYLMVFQNGILLDPDDYTATNGSSVVLDTAATLDDILNFVGFGTFDVANTYTKTEADNTFAPIAQSRRKNLIINGDFGVAQRGTSFTGLTGFPFTLDRWRWTESGTSVVDIAQTANSSEPPGRAYMYMAVTTGDAAFGATDYAGFLYQVEGNDAIAFGWNSASQSDKKNLTLSFWSAHHTAGTYCVAFRNSAVNRSYVAEYTQTVANTWEKQTINVPAPTDGTWLVDEGRGLQITFSMGAGTTLAAPAADTWYSADYHATSNQVNNVVDTNCRARFAAVQLEVGDIATDFEFRPFAEELALCQRYFEKSYSYEDKPGTVTTNGFWSNYLTGLPVGAHTMGQVIRFAVQKPSATYTVTAYSAVTGTSGKVRDGGVPGDITPTLDAKGSGGFRIYAVGTSSSGIDISGHWTADAEI